MCFHFLSVITGTNNIVFVADYCDIKNRNFFLVLIIPIFGVGRLKQTIQKKYFWCRSLKMTDTNNTENISRSNIFRFKIEKHGTLSPKKRRAEETRRAQAESRARSSLSLHTVSLSPHPCTYPHVLLSPSTTHLSSSPSRSRRTLTARWDVAWRRWPSSGSGTSTIASATPWPRHEDDDHVLSRSSNATTSSTV
jgi:hypothetical protein